MSGLLRRIVILAVLCVGSSWSVTYANSIYLGCSANEEACQSVGFDGCCKDSCECEVSGGTEICTCACCDAA